MAGRSVANLMFSRAAVSISTHDRASPAHFLSEVVATLGLVMVIFALARSGRARYTPAAVAAYIGAGYFFTSSTSFANPAITVGRVFSDTFAGIAPSSVPSFVGAQLLGGLAGLALIVLLYGGMTTAQASDIIVPHDGDASDVVPMTGMPRWRTRLRFAPERSRDRPSDRPLPLRARTPDAAWPPRVLLDRYAAGRVEVLSAGSEPGDQLEPVGGRRPERAGPRHLPRVPQARHRRPPPGRPMSS